MQIGTNIPLAHLIVSGEFPLKTRKNSLYVKTFRKLSL